MFVSTDAGGADSAAAASRAISPVAGTTDLLWVSNTESDVFRVGQDRPGLLPRRRAAGSRRRTSPGRGRSPRRTCRRTSRRFRSSTSARACSRRCRAPTQAAEAVLLAQIPQTARVSKTVQAPEVTYQGGTPEFQPIEKTTVAARRQHRQGHHQGRRPLLHVLPGRLVHVDDARPARGRSPATCRRRSTRSRSARRPTPSPTSPSRTSNDDAVVFATAPAFTGMMVAWGCAVWGTGYYYPPYYGFHGGYPDLLPALSDLRLRRVVQPVDRRVHARRRRLRPVRRRRRARSATTRGPAPTRAARSAYGPYGARGAASGLQPAHRRLRRDAAGLERLRQLGLDRRCSAAISGPARSATPTTSPA